MQEHSLGIGCTSEIRRNSDFYCDYCMNRFKNRSEFEQHLLRHTTNPETEGTESQHENLLQNTESSSASGRGFTDDEPLAKYARIHPVGTRLNTKRKLASREENTAKSSAIGSGLKGAKLLDRAYPADNRQRPYKCEICDFAFKIPSHLKDHQLVHSDQRPYECSDCFKTYKRKKDLKLHQANIHRADRPYSCDICDKSFYLKIGLERHQQIVHSEERNYHCQICSADFKTKGLLKAHQKNIHAITDRKIDSTNRLISCDICHKRFSSNRNLRNHKANIHSENRPPKIDTTDRLISCDICHKRFSSNRNLTNHKANIHSESDRNFVCEYCGKTFKCQRYLRDHQRNVHPEIHGRSTEGLQSEIHKKAAQRHPDLTELVLCDICGKKYTGRRNLEKHMKVMHSADKNNMCEICSKAFVLEYDLNRHQRNVHAKDKSN